jgi:hypothetical protein
VVSCFKDNDPPAKTGQGSPESEAALALAIELKEAVYQHLRSYPLTDVLARLPSVESDDMNSRSINTAFHLKPLHQPSPPMAPSWVFDLAKFTHAAHA